MPRPWGQPSRAAREAAMPRRWAVNTRLSAPDQRTSPGENEREQQRGEPLCSLSHPHIRIGWGEKEPDQHRGEALSSLSHPHTRIGWGEKEPEQHGEQQ